LTWQWAGPDGGPGDVAGFGGTVAKFEPGDGYVDVCPNSEYACPARSAGGIAGIEGSEENSK